MSNPSVKKVLAWRHANRVKVRDQQRRYRAKQKWLKTAPPCPNCENQLTAPQYCGYCGWSE